MGPLMIMLTDTPGSAAIDQPSSEGLRITPKCPKSRRRASCGVAAVVVEQSAET